MNSSFKVTCAYPALLWEAIYARIHAMGTNVAHCLKPQIILLSSPSRRSSTHGTCGGTATPSTLTLGGENRQQHSVPSNCWPTQGRRERWARKHLRISYVSQKALVMGEHPAFPQVLVLCMVLGYKCGINLAEQNSNKESCPTGLRCSLRFQRASYLVRIWVDLCRGTYITHWGWRLFLFKCGYQNHRDAGRVHLGHTCTWWSKKCRTSSFIQAQRKELLKNWLYLFWPQKILTNRCRLTRKDLRQLSPSYPQCFWAIYNLLCIK